MKGLSKTGVQSAVFSKNVRKRGGYIAIRPLDMQNGPKEQAGSV